MLTPISNTKLALLIGLVSVAKEVQALDRGVAWAVDNRWATAFTNTSITWYHHWQDPAVSQMASNIQYVPMNWGPKYASLWQQREAQMNASLPQYLLSYNEPDVPSQANMTPSDAVTSFMSDIYPWQQKGVLVSSPQIVYNTTWLSKFMTGIRAQGADVDYMAVHYYGVWNDTATPKKYLSGIYKTYGKKIWITELGTTQASGGEEEDQINFMNTMLTWMASTGYIDRVVWSGAWSIAGPPDNYISDQDGMFFPNATLREIGLEYAQISTAAIVTSTSSSTSVTPTSTSTSSTTTSKSTTTHSSSSSTSMKTATTTPASTAGKVTLAASTTHHTSTSSKKTTSTHHSTSTSTKHHHSTSTKKHKTTTSTKHHSTSTSTKKSSSTSKCKVAINKGNVARNWVDEEQSR